MLIRLDKNANKILFLNVNVNNLLLDENVNIFYWRKMLVIFFGSKRQYIPFDQNVNKLSLLEENFSYFLLDLNINMFLLD